MEEIQRLRYLEALEITQWVSKAPLPHAKISEYIAPAVGSDLALPSGEEQTQQSALSNPSSHSQVHNKNITKRQLTNEASVQNSVQSQDKMASPSPASSSQASPLNDSSEKESSLNATPNKAHQNTVTCAVQMQGKRGQYLILADIANIKGQISAQEQTLLNNITRAIDSLYTNQSTTLIPPEQFKWPLFESHFNATHIDQSEDAAKQSARAFLQSKLKHHRTSHVVILGTQAKELFSDSCLSYMPSLKPASTELSESGHVAEPSLCFTIGESLMALHENSTSKAQLWQSLLRDVSQV